MNTVAQALAFLQAQHDAKSTAWHNACEKLCRTAYGLPATYPSANDHYAAVPAANRYGTQTPSAGDLLLYRNGAYGHISIATGQGWQAWTNDYGGYGTVNLADGRSMAGWCGADAAYVSDAWWTPTAQLATHNGAAPDREADDMRMFHTPDGRVWTTDGITKRYVANPDFARAWVASGVVDMGEQSNAFATDLPTVTGYLDMVDDTYRAVTR